MQHHLDDGIVRCPHCLSAKTRLVQVKDERWYYCHTCDQNFIKNGHNVEICRDDRCERPELHLVHLEPPSPRDRLRRGGDHGIPTFCPSCGDKVLKHEEPPQCRSCDWRYTTTAELKAQIEEERQARWLDCPSCGGSGLEGTARCSLCSGAGQVHKSLLRTVLRYAKNGKNGKRGLAK